MRVGQKSSRCGAGSGLRTDHVRTTDTNILDIDFDTGCRTIGDGVVLVQKVSVHDNER